MITKSLVKNARSSFICNSQYVDKIQMLMNRRTEIHITVYPHSQYYSVIKKKHYYYMEQQRGISETLCWVERSRLVSVCAWFHIYKLLQQSKQLEGARSSSCSGNRNGMENRELSGVMDMFLYLIKGVGNSTFVKTHGKIYTFHSM